MHSPSSLIAQHLAAGRPAPAHPRAARGTRAPAAGGQDASASRRRSPANSLPTSERIAIIASTAGDR